MPAFFKNKAKINAIATNKTIGIILLPNSCFIPSKFKYFMRETIKKASNKTRNRNIKGMYCGKGDVSLPFLYIKIKEDNTPPLTVVGKP